MWLLSLVHYHSLRGLPCFYWFMVFCLETSEKEAVVISLAGLPVTRTGAGLNGGLFSETMDSLRQS